MSLLQSIRLAFLILSTITLCLCTIVDNGSQVWRIPTANLPVSEWVLSSEEDNMSAKSQLGELRTYNDGPNDEIVRKMRFIQYRAVETRQLING